MIINNNCNYNFKGIIENYDFSHNRAPHTCNFQNKLIFSSVRNKAYNVKSRRTDGYCSLLLLFDVNSSLIRLLSLLCYQTQQCTD